MTKPFNPNIIEGFSISAEDALRGPESLGSSIEDPQIEAIVAAILDKNTTMSAEDLAALEELLDDPELEPAQRKAALETIWNVVVSIIDYQWEAARHSRSSVACGSIGSSFNNPSHAASEMVSSSDNETSKSNEPNQEGGP